MNSSGEAVFFDSTSADPDTVIRAFGNGGEYDYENLDDRIGFYENLCAAKAFSTQEEKIGFIDKAGNAAIQFQYDCVGRFSYGLAAVAVEERGYNWSYIKANGNTVIDWKYASASQELPMSYASDFCK